MIIDNLFIHMIKMYGDIRSPYLISPEGETEDILEPLIRIKIVILEIQDMMS